MTKNFLKKEIKWNGQKISSRKSYLFKQKKKNVLSELDNKIKMCVSK